MNDERALDAALVAFVKSGPIPLRDRLNAAIAARDLSRRTCPSCAGTGVVVNQRQDLYEADGHRAASVAIPRGAEIECVGCRGTRVDLTRVAWLCHHPGYSACTPERPADPDHAACSWAIPVPDAVVQSNGS